MDYALKRVGHLTLNCRLIVRLGGWKVAGVVVVMAEEVGETLTAAKSSISLLTRISTCILASELLQVPVSLSHNHVEM